jgi:hypothetical protein
MEKILSATTYWTEVFKGTNLRGTLISILLLASISLAGINFVAPFVALFLNGLDVDNLYLINVIIGLCIPAGSFVGPPLLEYAGRRMALLSSFFRHGSLNAYLF